MGDSCCQSGRACGSVALVWECLGCGYYDKTINLEFAPEKCPDCGGSADYFVQTDVSDKELPDIKIE